MTSSAAMQATNPTFSDGRQGRHAADRPMGMVTSNGIAAARKFDDRAPATKKRKRHGHLARGASRFWGTFCDYVQIASKKSSLDASNPGAEIVLGHNVLPIEYGPGPLTRHAHRHAAVRSLTATPP